MTMSVRKSGVWKTVSALSVKKAGVWKAVTKAWVRKAGTWSVFYDTTTGGGGGGGGGSLTVTGSGTISGSGNGASAGGTVNTPLYSTLSVSGATGAVTYSWARYSAPDPQTPFTIVNPTTATPYWYARVNDANSPHTETWRVTVTDSVGATGTLDVVVSLSWTDTRYL